jgi:hypothetical protein
MKTNISGCLLTILVGTSLLFSGCTKLDEEVYDQVLETSFQPTESDIPSIIGPAYTIMRPMYADWQGNFDLQEEPADIIVTPVRPNGWYDGGTYQRMHYHEWNEVEWQPQNMWNNCFNGINTSNRILKMIETGSIPIANGKDELVAELKCLRAFYYSLLVDTHGNVPIVTDWSDISLPSQSSRSEVYAFVEKELLENLDKLSEKADQSMYGRINKWAAKATLAKLYLNAEVYTGTAQWEKCVAQCNDIINSGVYLLEANYKNNFAVNNNTSKELILAVPYDESLGAGNIIHMKTLATLHRLVLNMNAQPWGGNCAVPQFIDTYDADDTRLKDTWIMGPQYNVTTGELILTYGKDVPSIEMSDYFDGYRIGKYEIKQGAITSSSTDFPIFRYAQVLMMKAECLLRTGNAAEAAVLVTQVRERAFASTDPSKAAVTAAELAQGSSYKYGIWKNGTVTEPDGGSDIQFGRFYDELGWEFAAEAQRRQDMVRFGVFHRKKWFNHRPHADGKTRNLFPIPQEEINKNPNLQQNPDYR